MEFVGSKGKGSLQRRAVMLRESWGPLDSSTLSASTLHSDLPLRISGDPHSVPSSPPPHHRGCKQKHRPSLTGPFPSSPAERLPS